MATTRIILVPHTHWDREWYEPFSVFSERLVAMMDVLLDLGSKGFPHFHLDGQTALIDDYLRLRPDRVDQLTTLTRQGRLSVGPWFTQMDEFLTSGESHIRNLERGGARARELGAPLATGYMPDQFGHIGQMPQLLWLGGLERAVVWRGVPAVIDRDAFWWEAPDGSRVLTDYMAFGYFAGAPYDGIADPKELAAAITRTVERQRPFMASDRMLVMVGYDHAGPDPTLPERIEAATPFLDEIEPEIAGMERHLEGAVSDDLPVWRGELRSSARAHLLPNVYSARVHEKRERGRVEALVERYAEPLAALVPGFAWPAEQLDRVWQLLLWNGAHDSVCGCSHDQVALDVEERFAEARAICTSIMQGALRSLAGGDGDNVLAYNPSPFERDGVPAMGWLVRTPGDEPVSVEVDVREGGSGTLVVDGVPLRFLDEPDVGDLYNYCYATANQVPTQPSVVMVDGHTILARFDGMDVTVRVSRRQGEDFLRLDGVIRNDRPDHRLRLHVGCARPASTALAGSPFELVTRGLVSEGSDLEPASPTWPARGVVMAGGVALLHEGVFEYEVAGGLELAVTLLRCVGTISRDEMATRPFPAGPDVATPLAQMIGETEFSIGIRPHPDADGLLAAWERFALPLMTTPSASPPSSSGSLLQIAGDAELSGVRRSDGRIEVRVWNRYDDRPVTAEIDGRRLDLGPAEIRAVPLER